MKTSLWGKRAFAVSMVLALVFSCFGMYPAGVKAATSKVILVGDLQSELGSQDHPATDWDEKSEVTQMTSKGDGLYVFTGTLPAGTYQYKVALNGAWDESYGFSNYTNPQGTGEGGNIKITLAKGGEVTFYYNDTTHKIADSTYYTPLAGDKLPRIVGTVQTALGDTANSSPSDAKTLLTDPDFDSIYTAVAEVPQGDYKYQVYVPGATEADDHSYPDSPADLNLPSKLPVNFTYNAKDHTTDAKFTAPQDPGQVNPVPTGNIRIHYARKDKTYTGQSLWIYDDVKTPSSGDFPAGATPFPAGQTDSYGAYVDIPVIDGAKKISFVVVNRSTNVKDGGNKTFYIPTPENNEIWIKEGDDKVYMSPSGEMPIVLISAGLAGTTKLALSFLTTDGLPLDKLKTEIKVKDKDGNDLAVKNATIASKTLVELETDAYTLDQAPMTIEYSGKTITTSSDWRYLDAEYNYTGDDLGATYQEADKSATLKLWAPKASKVTVDVYDKSDSAVLVKSLDLTLGEHGVWSTELTPSNLGVGDVRGYFYQYEVTNGGVTNKVLDPYAKSMAVFTVNSKGEPGAGGDTVGKAAIVDLSQTNPDSYGYADIKGYEKREDAVVYEVHIRDFTSDPSIGDDFTDVRWGSYKAFEKKLDYLKSLGVTHIQLLPVMAWYYGDETKMGERELNYSNKDNEYNWGYDPQNYFSPDGAYSEDPKDPELRIKELKGLIDAVHKAGMGVVLDVVYTHMAKKEFLNDIVPNYYHFIDPSGKFIGGFSNNLATNHKMAEKLMVDSVKYWFKEYKIDGMRWDMMGDATYEAVQHALDAAKEINPKALFIGEGWRTFGGQDAEPDLLGKAADQDWVNKTDDMGVFSDEFRNEVKSGYNSEGQPRFITNGARSISTIMNNIKGEPSNVKFDDPGDIVPYIEAHDNLTLHDVIALSIKKDPSIPENELEIQKRIRLGNMLELTSQGTAFIHAGQEYGRTKQWKGPGEPEDKDRTTILKDKDGNSFGYFIHDSYDSSDAVNMFDWTKATDEVKFPVQTTTQKYTSGLIELRKSTNAFRLGDQSLVNSNVTLIPANEIKTDDLVIGYKNKSTDGTGNYYVFMNGDSQPRTLTLGDDLTQGSVLVDNDQAGTSAIPAKDQSGFKLTTNSIELEPLTAVIIKQDAAAAKLSSLVPDSRNYSLQVNDTHQTTVVAKYDDGSKASVTGTATYVSDKPEVATVTDKGLVKATGLGTATITVSYGGRSKTVTVLVNPKRFVQLTYTRPDKDFKDWNLWVWNTGVKNDQIDFTIKDGKASVLIEVAPNATNVGFVLRKGTDWATAKQDFPNDRYIPLTPGELFTKVNVTSMVRELDIKPSNTGPVMKDGSITFIYRDDDLFRQGTMTDITAVKVKVNGTEYPMVYDETKEWFSYKLTKANEGDNNYTFLVTTKDGNTTEVNDPKNTVDGKSVLVYHNPTVKVTASVNPAAVTSNQNAVLTVKADSSLAGVSYREGTLDLTALGGPSQVKLDTALMKQTIAVKDTVAAGIKTIPITLVDQYGNTHKGSTTIEVKARTYTGDKLDFDWDEARIYFALTDRFKDGDLSNDYNVDKTHPEAYHGGDFRGMIDNLDYIQKLGINTLWITPIVDNIDFNKGADFGSKQYGYHGYWAKDFSQLDEHLGDMATFKELINKAHDRGIKVMVDVVLNHTGYGVKEDDDDYPTITPEDKERFKGMLRMDNVSADTDPVKGELAYLPDFKTEDPAVRDKVVAWQSGWLDNARTDRGDTIDYFRVDTVKHVDGTTWKAFKNALTTIDPKFKLVGEYFGGTIDNNGDMLQTGQMDGLLDFGFKDAAKNFANGKINDTDAYMQDRESKIDNTKTMAQFLSSHDENGFLTEYVGGDKGKLKVAAALQITAKGQPVIYYGEELGNSGKKEGDMSKGEFSQNRSDMPWDKLTTEQALHDHYQKLLNIRAKYSKVFSKGTRTKLAGTDELGYLAFNKHYGSEDVVTVINTNTTAASATFTVPFAANALVQDEYSGKTYTVSADRKVTVSVPGRDSGGTVILAAAQTSTPGNPTPGNPTPGNPTPSPSVPTTPSDSQVVNESSLKNGKDGKVEVGIAQGKKSVLLPIQAAKALGTNDLVIKLGSLNVTLPSGVLSTIQGMVSGAEADGSQIRFEANPLESSSANTTVGRLQRNGAKVSQASDVYEFTISIIKKDGTRIPVTTFKEPITVSFKLTGNPNKDLIGVYYLADNGTLEYVGGVLNGDVLTAKVKHFSKYAALEIDKSFADVPASHWASAAIKSLTAKQIVTGVTDTKYQPNSNVSRAEFTALLTRALGLQTDEHAAFADVKPGAWYASYVDAAVKAGIVNGRSKDTFAPNETISREEMAVMLIRALEVKQGKKTDAAASAAAFADASKISSWAASYVNTAASLELVQGKENHQFDPQGFMTRAESAQVIYKLLAK